MNLIPPERVLKILLEQGLFRDQLAQRLAMVCWVMLAAAAGIWIILGRNRKGYDVTSVYWLGCGVGIWLCLRLSISSIIPASNILIGFLSVLFAALPLWSHRRMLKRTWFNNPSVLTRSVVLPGGLLTSITALSLLVFFLGLCYLTTANTARSALMMGVSLLLLVQYDYRPESALAGMVMITLAIVSAFLDLSAATGRPSATILNLTVIPLSVMALVWIWLGTVWSQQIHDGKPLTTSAKLVPLTHHLGAMLLGFATLLAIKLALWPLMLAAADNHDNRSERFVLLMLAYAILLAANVYAARRLKLVSLGTLAAMNVFFAVMAILTRFPEVFQRYFYPYWRPIAITYLVLVVLATLALGVRKMKNEPI